MIPVEYIHVWQVPSSSMDDEFFLSKSPLSRPLLRPLLRRLRHSLPRPLLHPLLRSLLQPLQHFLMCSLRENY